MIRTDFQVAYDKANRAIAAIKEHGLDEMSAMLGGMMVSALSVAAVEEEEKTLAAALEKEYLNLSAK